jgi:diguanylate cyclase (GGDEF)-like protein
MKEMKYDGGLQELYSNNLKLLGWITAVFVLPFATYSFFSDRYIIGFLGYLLVIISGLNTYFIHKKQRLLIPYVLWFLVYMIELFFLTKLLGLKALLWAYPIIFTIYFIQERKAARIYSAITYIFLVILGLMWAELELTIRFAVTLFISILFCDGLVGVLMKMESRLRELALRDPLTNAHNRRHMNDVLKNTTEEIRRNFGPGCLLMFDIDYFKKINDKHGHSAGDSILIKLVDTLHKRQRKLDYVFRSGGEEFVLLLRNTELQQALALAESLRQHVEENISYDGQAITISLGVAEYQTGETEEEWLGRADAHMYEAKESGRNCVYPQVLT